jgi:hypothetical protein
MAPRQPGRESDRQNRRSLRCCVMAANRSGIFAALEKSRVLSRGKTQTSSGQDRCPSGPEIDGCKRLSRRDLYTTPEGDSNLMEWCRI